MALLDVSRDRVGRQSHVPKRASDAGRQLSTWRKAVLEIVGTFSVLIGIAVGILTLRFALVLMHGVLH